MNTKIGENEPLTLSHCQWLGLKNVNGALVREGMKGEVQFDGKFHYCENNVAVKTLHTCKDLNDIVIPIANAEIAKRNAALLSESTKQLIPITTTPRLFQILDEMNQSDIENDTRLVTVSPTLVSTRIVKQGSTITMGADCQSFDDLSTGKVIPLLILVDKEEYLKRKGPILKKP